jgi:hypothetical protein
MGGVRAGGISPKDPARWIALSVARDDGPMIWGGDGLTSFALWFASAL